MEFKNLNLEELDCKELELIEGGSEHSDSVWYIVGCIVRGFQVFATEGGRNAGLCVH